MRKVFFVVGIALGAMACSEDEVIEPVYVRDIHPDLSGYVETFYSEAAARGIELEPNVILDLAPLGEPSPNNYNYADFTKDGQIEIVFNSDIFYDMDDQRKEALVFFYLGRQFGRLMIITDTKSFMNPRSFAHGYDTADREEMINELFGKKG